MIYDGVMGMRCVEPVYFTAEEFDALVLSPIKSPAARFEAVADALRSDVISLETARYLLEL